MSKTPRFTAGIDVWFCTCGQVNIMGRTCKCGKTNADIIVSASSPKPKRKSGREPYSPKNTSPSGLLESYHYRKDS